MKQKLPNTEEAWKKKLTPEQYAALRQKSTEYAFTGKYWKTKEKGIYLCAGCGAQLFSSDTKFDSGTGWPSFWQPVDQKAIRKEEDHSFFQQRTEVLCAKCGGHLGHVFMDGPKPAGLRYCINSCSLNLKKPDKK